MAGVTIPFVIDASVAVKFLTQEAGSTEAFVYLESDEPLLAPDLILPEVANALWKKIKNSELLEVHAEAGLEDLPQFFVDDPSFFRCTAHFGVESRVDAWWHGTEGLPEQRSDTYQPLLDRWSAASPQG